MSKGTLLYLRGMFNCSVRGHSILECGYVQAILFGRGHSRIDLLSQSQPCLQSHLTLSPIRSALMAEKPHAKQPLVRT